MTEPQRLTREIRPPSRQSAAEAIAEKAAYRRHHPLRFTKRDHLTGQHGRKTLAPAAVLNSIASPHTAFDSAAEGTPPAVVPAFVAN
ncbi:MAG: hypothetical protein U0894_13925 [Pirellulales bacterium]